MDSREMISDQYNFLPHLTYVFIKSYPIWELLRSLILDQNGYSCDQSTSWSPENIIPFKIINQIQINNKMSFFFTQGIYLLLNHYLVDPLIISLDNIIICHPITQKSNIWNN